MAIWSGIKAKLENEYLAESLRGHIQYLNPIKSSTTAAVSCKYGRRSFLCYLAANALAYRRIST